MLNVLVNAGIKKMAKMSKPKSTAKEIGKTIATKSMKEGNMEMLKAKPKALAKPMFMATKKAVAKPTTNKGAFKTSNAKMK